MGYLPDGCTEPSDRETYADEFDSDRESAVEEDADLEAEDRINDFEDDE